MPDTLSSKPAPATLASSRKHPLLLRFAPKSPLICTASVRLQLSVSSCSCSCACSCARTNETQAAPASAVAIVSRRFKRDLETGLSLTLRAAEVPRFERAAGKLFEVKKVSRVWPVSPLLVVRRCDWKRYSSLSLDIAPNASRVVSQTPSC
jgi:hypothetical protein